MMKFSFKMHLKMPFGQYRTCFFRNYLLICVFAINYYTSPGVNLNRCYSNLRVFCVMIFIICSNTPCHRNNMKPLILRVICACIYKDSIQFCDDFIEQVCNENSIYMCTEVIVHYICDTCISFKWQYYENC